MLEQLVPYVCGGLTHAPPEVRAFYRRIAKASKRVTGLEAFNPCDHFDPIANVSATDTQVYTAEERQIRAMTSAVLAMYCYESWGSGMEVQMANHSWNGGKRGIPAIIACPVGRKVSRIVSGGPAVKKVIYYHNEDEAESLVVNALEEVLSGK